MEEPNILSVNPDVNTTLPVNDSFSNLMADLQINEDTFEKTDFIIVEDENLETQLDKEIKNKTRIDSNELTCKENCNLTTNNFNDINVKNPDIQACELGSLENNINKTILKESTNKSSDIYKVYPDPEYNLYQQGNSDVKLDKKFEASDEVIDLSVKNEKKSDKSVSSVFKNILFWPTEELFRKKNKSKYDDVPPIASSPEWIEYYEKKDELAREKEREKLKKKLEREMKKKIKDEQNKENKVIKKAKIEANKIKLEKDQNRKQRIKDLEDQIKQIKNEKKLEKANEKKKSVKQKNIKKGKV